MPDVQGMDRDACSRRFAHILEGIPFYINGVMTETLQTAGAVRLKSIRRRWRNR
jgi:hypothetical protein